MGCRFQRKMITVRFTFIEQSWAILWGLNGFNTSSFLVGSLWKNTALKWAVYAPLPKNGSKKVGILFGFPYLLAGPAGLLIRNIQASLEYPRWLDNEEMQHAIEDIHIFLTCSVDFIGSAAAQSEERCKLASLLFFFASKQSHQVFRASCPMF